MVESTEPWSLGRVEWQKFLPCEVRNPWEWWRWRKQYAWRWQATSVAKLRILEIISRQNAFRLWTKQVAPNKNRSGPKKVVSLLGLKQRTFGLDSFSKFPHLLVPSNIHQQKHRRWVLGWAPWRKFHHKKLSSLMKIVDLDSRFVFWEFLHQNGILKLSVLFFWCVLVVFFFVGGGRFEKGTLWDAGRFGYRIFRFDMDVSKVQVVGFLSYRLNAHHGEFELPSSYRPWWRFKKKHLT